MCFKVEDFMLEYKDSVAFVFLLYVALSQSGSGQLIASMHWSMMAQSEKPLSSVTIVAPLLCYEKTPLTLLSTFCSHPVFFPLLLSNNSFYSKLFFRAVVKCLHAQLCCTAVHQKKWCTSWGEWCAVFLFLLRLLRGKGWWVQQVASKLQDNTSEKNRRRR